MNKRFKSLKNPRKKGKVWLKAISPDSRLDCTAGARLTHPGDAVEIVYAPLLAFRLECMLVDPLGNWNEAARLLDEYKAEWEKVDPSPWTFLGEPILQEIKS